MAVQVKHHVCRVCHAACNLVVELEDGAVKSIRGDKHDPVFHGYSCIKGRESASLHTLPSRLLRTVKRQADGNHAPVDSAAAAREVAQRLQRIVAQHGPRAVALYIGTYGYGAFANNAMAQALMKAIGSPMVFTSVTIDQPGKGIALAMHGPWLAGTPPIQSWDALLLVGTNPIVSMNGGLGVNPARTLKQAKYRGMKLVVVDPRKSECARHADVFLQCRPGEDAAVLAGITRLLIEENLTDAAFVAAQTQGLAELKEAVAPYTPSVVAARAGIRAEDLIAAARLLGQARRGAVSAGTGANMSGQGNVVEYLVKVITTLRGWWLRAGEIKQNTGVLIEGFAPIAASPGPFPAVDFGEKMRIRGLSECAAGLPTAALADEILTPGEGQVRALIVLGGNPMLAWPDQVRTQAAMRALDLLVCFDPRLEGTGRHAHYVFAPKLSLEIESNTSANELYSNFGPGWGFEFPYAQVSAPVLDPPPDSDVHEEWEILFDIARHMDLQLEIKPFSILDPARAAQMATPMDMTRKPDVPELWRMVLKGAPVDYDTVRAHDHARVYDRPVTRVQEKPAGWAGCLQIGAAPMMRELIQIAAHPSAPTDDAEFPLRLISRRLNDVVNSSGHDNPRQQRKWAYNPAFMNPADLQAVGARAGDVLEIRSAAGSILGIAEPSPEVRCGCVSMSHAWGRNPGEVEQPDRDGGNTGRLLSTAHRFDRYTGIPLMSSVPVAVRLAAR